MDNSCLHDNREELTIALRSRLIECGWRDQVATMCRNIIQKQGIEHTKFEDIISEVGHKAKATVPEKVKLEMVDMIRNRNK